MNKSRQLINNKKETIMNKNKESQIEFVNEEDLDLLGGASEMEVAEDQVCGNLRKCGWNDENYVNRRHY